MTFNIHYADQITTNNDFSNTAAGDPKGSVYGNGQFTYNMPSARKSVENGEVMEEVIIGYTGFLKWMIALGILMIIAGNGAFFLASAIITSIISFPVVYIYTSHKVKARYQIYQLN